MDRNSIKGTIFVLLSAVCFSLGGVLIKSIPWSSVTIQGLRSVFSSLVIGGYMLLRHQRFVWNKTVLFGAVCNTVMAFTFVAATKMTTAANAIVLQFTEPVFVILLLWILYKKKPGKDAVISCIIVCSGIPAYIRDIPMSQLNPEQMAEPSLYASLEPWICMVLLGIFQFGFSYIFLSKGLDYVSPVTASLTSTIEPILNPLLVAAFCGETVGILAAAGAVLVVGTATVYNVRQAMKAGTVGSTGTSE